jgi:hypothetical protein
LGVTEVQISKARYGGNLLLRHLRGIRAQRRPDIIDFTNRVFYEIKSADDTRKGTVQLASTPSAGKLMMLIPIEDIP